MTLKRKPGAGRKPAPTGGRILRLSEDAARMLNALALASGQPRRDYLERVIRDLYVTQQSQAEQAR